MMIGSALGDDPHDDPLKREPVSQVKTRLLLNLRLP